MVLLGTKDPTAIKLGRALPSKMGIQPIHYVHYQSRMGSMNQHEEAYQARTWREMRFLKVGIPKLSSTNQCFPGIPTHSIPSLHWLGFADTSQESEQMSCRLPNSDGGCMLKPKNSVSKSSSPDFQLGRHTWRPSLWNRLHLTVDRVFFGSVFHWICHFPSFDRPLCNHGVMLVEQ